jgi:hypothetical protein
MTCYRGNELAVSMASASAVATGQHLSVIVVATLILLG